MSSHSLSMMGYLAGLAAPDGYWTVFDGNAHALLDTTEDENPLGRRPVIIRPYILYCAYRYESGCFRSNGGQSVPYRPLVHP